MKLDSANAISLVRRTSMPVLDAARSLARTPSQRSPVAPRRRLATATAIATSTTRHTTPNAGRGKADPAAPMPRSSPNSRGRGTDVPARPPLNQLHLNTSSSTTVAAASVAMARLIPRTRTAGSPMTRPKPVAISAGQQRGQRERHVERRRSA